MAKSCYDCKHCIDWKEQGTTFTDCKLLDCLAESDEEHAEWYENHDSGSADNSEIGATCPKFEGSE